MTIKSVERIFNSDKICRSYSDLNFGVTCFGTQCRNNKPVLPANILAVPTFIDRERATVRSAEIERLVGPVIILWSTIIIARACVETALPVAYSIDE